MAKARKKAASSGETTLKIVTGSSSGEADGDEIEELDAIEGGELSRALEEMRTVSGAKVEVYRLEPEPGFCANIPVALFTHEKIGEDWGPGKYKIRFKGAQNR